MPIYQAFILGLVQGLGEFLPISSSAHLILVPWLFKWRDPGLTFDIALHLGTLLAVVAFFWRDWIRLIRDGFTKGFSTSEGRLFWFIVVASIPGALAGIALESYAETIFRTPMIIGVMLIIMGIILYLADRFGKKRTNTGEMTWGQSLGVGISQALAIIPGVSRSGITMTSGLFFGLTREAAARFSFLLSTPIVAGAGLLKLKDLPAHAINAPFIVGVLTSAIVGFLVIGLLLRWLKRSSYAPFVWYRFFLGAVVITVFFLRK
ncbi:MAG TPA: undecaprenyl-diphosphatase UppP [Bacillota bacterium]|jgi:undecaprenyl-diphosphatase|nr:undecaprenyl-diphosphatase UppP [Bacillota bacterium]